MTNSEGSQTKFLINKSVDTQTNAPDYKFYTEINKEPGVFKFGNSNDDEKVYKEDIFSNSFVQRKNIKIWNLMIKN